MASVPPTVTITSPPTSGPDPDYVDSMLQFDTDGNGSGNSFQDFKWVGKGNTTNKCEKEGVPEHCPLTCDAKGDTTDSCAAFVCEDAPNKFKGKGSNKFPGKKDCEWVSKSSLGDRCDYKGVKGTCRATCDYYG